MTQPTLLRIPKHFRTVDDVLGAASKLGLTNVLVLSEKEDGSIVFLDNDLTLSKTNWLLDRMKYILLDPHTFERHEI